MWKRLFLFKELEILVLATEHLYLVLFEFLLTVIHLYADLWWHDYWWTFTRYRSWCKNNLAHHIVHFVCCQVTDISAVILLQVNPVRAKELSNVRSAGKDENVKLTPPRLVSTLRPVCYSVVCFYVLSYIYMNFSLLEWFFRSSLSMDIGFLCNLL